MTSIVEVAPPVRLTELPVSDPLVVNVNVLAPVSALKLLVEAPVADTAALTVRSLPATKFTVDVLLVTAPLIVRLLPSPAACISIEPPAVTVPPTVMFPGKLTTDTLPAACVIPATVKFTPLLNKLTSPPPELTAVKLPTWFGAVLRSVPPTEVVLRVPVVIAPEPP